MSKDLTTAEIQRLTRHIEAYLRAEGVTATWIPCVFGAGFAMSLIDLPRSLRVGIIKAHLTALRDVAHDVMAPEGPPEKPEGPLQ